jgi:CelD/BcsL family acetyltransferase involved in cellulose biosynthesis
VLVGWTHPFAPLGTPLLDRDAGSTAISAWLDHVAADPRLPKVMLLPLLPAKGALARCLDDAIAASNGASRAFGAHRRALLAPAHAGERYIEDAIGHKKRKELRRQRHRLSEAGAVTFTLASEPAAVAQALGDFLALEASGWKGRAGTAALSDTGVRAFVDAAVTTLAREGKARVARLEVGDRAAAAIVMLTSGTTAWCWKIAYDESLARCSPGVQLLLDATQSLLDDTAIARADSCATADHPMIDHVWRERLLLHDRLLRVGGDHRVAFGLAGRLEGLRRTAAAGAKALRDRVRTRAQ